MSRGQSRSDDAENASAAQNEIEGLSKEQRKDEILKIRKRRSVQFGAEGDGDSETENSLVGLALSGGGVRSGAISLGVIQALHEAGAFKYVDLLSTVSGGGYAGAYLSSAIMSAKQNGSAAQDDTASVEESNRRPYDKALENIAAKSNQRQPERMLDFVFGGSYLRKPWEFLNRYLIGLCLMWLVVGSGLIAVSALLAYVFRSLDASGCRAWLEAFGFEGDFMLALFPSAVLAVFWGITWVASYLKDPSRPAGVIARGVLYLLVFTTLVGVANLLVTGNIKFSHGFTTNDETVDWVTKTIMGVILGAFAIGMLPYFSPKALIRSGTSPNGPGEKYIFWIATRTLAFGVPFLVIAFFMQENISGENDSRSSKLVYSSEVSSWYKTDIWVPFWRQIAAEEDDVSKDIWTNCRVLYQVKDKGILLRYKKLREVADPKEDALLALIDDAEKATTAVDGFAADKDAVFAELTLEQAFLVLEAMAQQYSDSGKHLRYPSCLWNLVEYLGEKAIGVQNADEEDVSLFVSARKDMQNTRNLIVASLNSQLARSDFYELFPMGAQVPSTLLEEASEIKLSLARANSDTIKAGLQAKVIDVNRRLLTAYSGGQLRDRSVVFSGVVLAKDQQYRYFCFFRAALVFILFAALMNLNSTSLHSFYTRRLSEMWIEPNSSGGRDYPIHELTTTDSGGPFHLINGSILLLGTFERKLGYERRGHFLFSQGHCGSDRLKYVPSGEYMNGELKLEDAIAISGGALTPMQSVNPLVMMLLILGNIRLGQWLENPNEQGVKRSRMAAFFHMLPFTPLRLIWSMRQRADKRPFCFVSDGGLHENLGIAELLNRRCRLIIAVDAGQDDKFAFTDFAKLQRWVRMRYGIGISALGSSDKKVDLAGIKPGKDGYSADHYTIAQIHYPDESGPSGGGILIYIKSSLTHDEPVELEQAIVKFPGFPHDSTADQFYNAGQFENYRMLGHHMVEHLCGHLKQSAALKRGDVNYEEFTELMLKSARAGLSETADGSQDQADKASHEGGKFDLATITAQLSSTDPSVREVGENQLREFAAEAAKEPRTLLEVSRSVRRRKFDYTDFAIRSVLFEHASVAFAGLVDVLTNSKEEFTLRKDSLFYLQEYYRHLWCNDGFEETLSRFRKVAEDSQENDRLRKAVQKFLEEMGRVKVQRSVAGL